MNWDLFKHELDNALQYEKEASRRILKLYNDYVIDTVQDENNYTTVHYDFSIIKNDKVKTFEVKYNRLAHIYGSYFMEIKTSTGIPSGLSITKAKYHILVNDINEYILIKTSKIRRILKDKKLTVRVSKNGVIGFVITKTDILHYGGVFLLE